MFYCIIACKSGFIAEPLLRSSPSEVILLRTLRAVLRRISDALSENDRYSDQRQLQTSRIGLVLLIYVANGVSSSVCASI